MARMSKAKEKYVKEKRQELRRVIETWMKKNVMPGLELSMLRIRFRLLNDYDDENVIILGSERADEILLPLIRRRTVDRRAVGEKCINGIRQFLNEENPNMTIEEFANDVTADRLMSLGFGIAQLKLLNEALKELAYAPL